MKPEKIKAKFDTIKQRLTLLHQRPQKISDAAVEHFKLQLSEFEHLIGPEMDHAEMFFIEGQLEEIERRLSGDA